MSVTSRAGDRAAQAEKPASRARRKAKAQLSEGKKAERKLGWLLCAPAALVMVAVTAYPILYSVWLSLQRFDLKAELSPADAQRFLRTLPKGRAAVWAVPS